MSGKKVLLGVSGGIAAYKAVALASLLSKKGALVRVVLTRAAARFVTPLSFQGVTRGPVLVEPLSLAEDGVGAHVSWAKWAETTLVAPATADLLARMAAGMGDDLLAATLLCVRGRRILAPAMNRLLWENPLVQRNLATLESVGWEVAGPATGRLADGDEGPGRMLEPGELAALVLS